MVRVLSLPHRGISAIPIGGLAVWLISTIGVAQGPPPNPSPSLTAADKAAISAMQQKAAEGDAVAQVTLGALFYSAGMGGDAAPWLRKSAEQGNSFAMTILGDIYLKGLGVPQDYSEAAKWSLKAAEQEHALAQVNMAAMYFQGHGVVQDYVSAAKWALRAGEQDCPDDSMRICAQARGLAASIYFAGLGVPQDYVLTHMWANLAAATWPAALGPNTAAKLRDDVTTKMTTEQIAEAQRLAREWKPKRKFIL
jgi:uncharacterized protein